MNLEMKQQQIKWRRARILELSSEGYNISKISQKLQLDRVAVHRDIQFLRWQAQENLRKLIHETISVEYQKFMTDVKRNLDFTGNMTKQMYEDLRKDVDREHKHPAGLILGSAGLDDSGNNIHAADIWESEQDPNNFVSSRLKPAMKA